MNVNRNDLGDSFLQSGELVLSDEDEDSDSLLADEIRGMYRNKLKGMDEVEEKREEAHKVRYFPPTTKDVNINFILNIRSFAVNILFIEHEFVTKYKSVDRQYLKDKKILIFLN